MVLPILQGLVPMKTALIPAAAHRPSRFRVSNVGTVAPGDGLQRALHSVLETALHTFPSCLVASQWGSYMILLLYYPPINRNQTYPEVYRYISLVKPYLILVVTYTPW